MIVEGNASERHLVPMMMMEKEWISINRFSGPINESGLSMVTPGLGCLRL